MEDTNLVLINIDGCRQDIFYELLQDKEIPNFYSVLKNGKIVEKAYSIYPTNTLPAQVSIFTGVYPKDHGVVGNSWFDRKKIFYRDYATAENALRVYGFEFFGPPFILIPNRKEGSILIEDIKTKTIYQILNDEGFTSATVFSHIANGATFWIRPKKQDMLQYALCHEDYIQYIAFEKTTLKRAVEFLRTCKVLPNLLTLYFSGLDGYSHRYGPLTQRWYLKEVVDKLFREFLDVFKEKNKLEKTHFLVISDHGQIEVKKDKKHFLTPQKISSYLQKKNFSLFNPKKGRLQDADLISTEGGSIFYIKNKKTNKWKDEPNEEEKYRLIEALLLSQKELGPWINGFLIKENGKYKIYHNGKTEKKEIFFNNNREKYPEAITRIEGLTSDKSGDVLSLINFEEGFYFTDRPHAGEHGNLTPEESIVPFVFSGPKVEPGKIEKASICDVVPTILKIFGITDILK